MAPVDFGHPAEGLRQAATLGRGALGRARAVATMAVRGKRLGDELQRADCKVIIRGAQRLGLPAAVATGTSPPLRLPVEDDPRRDGAEAHVPPEVLRHSGRRRRGPEALSHETVARHPLALTDNSRRAGGLRRPTNWIPPSGGRRLGCCSPRGQEDSP